MTIRDRALRALGRVVDDIAREAEKSKDPEAALELLELLSDICSRYDGPWWDTYVAEAIVRGRSFGGVATDDEVARAVALSRRCGGRWESDGSSEDAWRLIFAPRGSR